MQEYTAQNIRNIAIMGHGGSGKTQLAEAMLFKSKAIDRMGKSQDGNTVTDFDQEECRRGISINTSYAALERNKHKLNLIDTPGDFDFLADQQLGMMAGDTILLVTSAKDGLSVGAEKVMRLSESKDKPVALVINRLDEPNTDFYKALAEFEERYGAKVLPLSLPVRDGEKFVGIVDVMGQKLIRAGAKGDSAEEVTGEFLDKVTEIRGKISEQIAETDEDLMMKYFDGEEFTPEEWSKGVKQAILTSSLIPVFAASALEGIGVELIMDTAINYFPNTTDVKLPKAEDEAENEIELSCDPAADLAAFVFKTIVDPFVGRISLIKVLQGTFTADENVWNVDKQKEERINGLFALRGKKQFPVTKLEAGDIGALTKLSETQTNETLSAKGKGIKVKPVQLPVPCLTLCIKPVKKGEEDKIMQGMNRLRDEDPSFDIRNDPETKQLLLSGQGEVQLDVLCAKLKGKYNVEAELSEAKVAYRETIRKSVKVQGKHKKQSGGHGQYGDVWIEFEPCDSETLVFEEKVFGGAVPKNYFPAVEKGLQEAVEEGVLAGYPVVNLKATLYDGSYHDVDSSEMSFKLAARLAYKNGLPQASPVLLEPIMSVKVFIPDSYLGDIMGDLSKRRGRILGMGAAKIKGFQVVEGEAPMSELSKYATDLKSMTQGRGWFVIDFARYEQAPNEVSEKVIEEAKREEE